LDPLLAQPHESWYLNESKAEGNGFFQVCPYTIHSTHTPYTLLNGFFQIETNYDHDKPVPKADDRRTNATLHMKAMGRSNVGMGSMTKVRGGEKR
jgi:hypothetical protein